MRNIGKTVVVDPSKIRNNSNVLQYRECSEHFCLQHLDRLLEDEMRTKHPTVLFSYRSPGNNNNGGAEEPITADEDFEANRGRQREKCVLGNQTPLSVALSTAASVPAAWSACSFGHGPWGNERGPPRPLQPSIEAMPFSTSPVGTPDDPREASVSPSPNSTPAVFHGHSLLHHDYHLVFCRSTSGNVCKVLLSERKGRQLSDPPIMPLLECALSFSLHRFHSPLWV